MKRIAIILAGGVGKRVGGDMPKQFLEVLGKPIIAYSIEAFQSVPTIDEICIVCHADYLTKMQSIVEEYSFSKVRHIIPGGKERYHSTLAALALYHNDEDILLIHDGVRPLVTQLIIENCISALDQYNAVEPAIQTTDTIVVTDKTNCVVSIPERQNLRDVQTPQGFRRKTLAHAFDLAMADGQFKPTDDCGVVHKYITEEPIYLIDGDTRNIKITYPQDLKTMAEILSSHCLR